MPALSLPPGVDLLWFDALDSTNDEAKRQAASGRTGPLWIVAERQTKGRGRHGRRWVSEAGNLAATYLCAPRLPPAGAACLSFAAALAVVDVLDPILHGVEGPAAVSVKWPNDVLVRGRKIAGILLESAASGPDGAVSWLAIGIGLNLAHHPEGTEFPATSLKAEGLPVPPLGDAVEQLAKALDRRLQIYAREGFAPIRDAWLTRGPAPGTALTVRLGRETLKGRFGGLGEEGALLLQGAEGALRPIAAGDVFFGDAETPDGARS